MAFHYMIIYGFFITYHWSESEQELPDDSVICARSRKQSDWGVKDEGVMRKLKKTTSLQRWYKHFGGEWTRLIAFS